MSQAFMEPKHQAESLMMDEEVKLAFERVYKSQDDLLRQINCLPCVKHGEDISALKQSKQNGDTRTAMGLQREDNRWGKNNTIVAIVAIIVIVATEVLVKFVF